MLEARMHGKFGRAKGREFVAGIGFLTATEKAVCFSTRVLDLNEGGVSMDIRNIEDRLRTDAKL
jgi:hypothetical protein